MKSISKIFIAMCVLLISWRAEAHQPDLSSTLLVEKEENTWVLQIRSSLTAFEYEVEKYFGKQSYATPEEFQDQVLEIVTSQTSIMFNKNSVLTLKNGSVKLGHETSVTFELNGPTEVVQTVDVKNSTFKDISRNQNALIVLKEGFAKDQFILDKNNNHTVELKVSDSKFEIVTNGANRSFLLPLLITGVLLIGGILFFYSGRKNLMNMRPSLQNV